MSLARPRSRAAVATAATAFALSGFAALVDQVAWQRLLALFSGVHSWSITVIVTAFMVGLGFGSLAGGRVADRLTPRSAVRAFAACELLIAAFAAASPWLYQDVAYTRLGSLVRHASLLPFVHLALLSIPTGLMGASLPMLARALAPGASPGAARRIASLYAANTLGAALGAFVATWCLMGLLGLGGSLRFAAGLNLLAALLALLVATSPDLGAESSVPAAVEPASDWRLWAWAYALSGFIALGLEILWLRVLGTMTKASPYAFGHVIGVLLTALGTGGAIGARLAARNAAGDAGRVFFKLQWAAIVAAGIPFALLPLLVAKGGLLASLFVFLGHGTPPLAPSLWLLVPVVVVAPAALMMGAGYAWVQRAVQTHPHEVGWRVGVVQAANVFGCAVGSLATGLLLLSTVGTALALKAFVALGSLFGWLAVRRQPRRPVHIMLAVGAPLALAAALPGHERLWSALHGVAPGKAVIVEDASSVVSMQPAQPPGSLYTVMRVNGLGHSGIPYGGAWAILGVLPVLTHADARRVLIIGMGTGCTPWASALLPGVEQVDLYEIARPERQVLEGWETRGQHPEVQQFLRHPRIKTSFTDGRLALRLESSLYDVIEADAADPQMAYSGNLYSLDFFLEARRRLGPGGLFCTYVPSARVAETAKAAFPFVLDVQWGALRLMLGSESEVPLDAERFRARLRAPGVRAALWATPRGAELWSELDAAAGALVITAIAPDAPRDRSNLNTDLFPRDEFDWRLAW